MTQKNYCLGYPRIGEFRELKKSLEAYWNGKSSLNELETTAKNLRKKHWQIQKDAKIELISINDFSYYDNMLDAIIMLECEPKQYLDLSGDDRYFAIARGDKTHKALGMTKWLNTNYHYIAPEFDSGVKFGANIAKISQEFQEAKQIIEPKNLKVNLIGPFTFLLFAKSGLENLKLLDDLVRAYSKILAQISALNSDLSIDIAEPVFVKDLSAEVISKISDVYTALKSACNNKIIVSTFFEHAKEAIKELATTNIDALALDLVEGKENLDCLDILAPTNIDIFCGVIDGKNIWVNDYAKTLQTLDQVAQKLPKERIKIGTSCSLLHVPYSLNAETKLNAEIKSYLSFAAEKLLEISDLTSIFFDKNQESLAKNKALISQKANSTIIHNQNVLKRVADLDKTAFTRGMDFEERIKLQRQKLAYPDLPTTTIGSFPQDANVRKTRRDFKNGTLTEPEYKEKIKNMIKKCIKDQEALDIDVLVHGEFERNDMVEYFGEQLDGFAFSENGWVQSYGSRCVKPPILYGDVSRPSPMTTEWIGYAQSLTKKPVKGMLTGPVTMLNWSFLRDDMPYADILPQVALAIRDEISDLQKANIGIVQVDEAAFKEGYPLRKSKIKTYEDNSVKAFKLATAVAAPQTQIHTHMCYSDFKDIMPTIEAMDADVISIETSREGNSLLNVFRENNYKKEIGAGVYDIHSPRIPSKDEFKDAISQRLEVTLKTRMWVNPDCGLKTRKEEECFKALENMVQATKELR